MHGAEIMIRNDIEELDNSHLVYRVQQIRNDLKYAMWHGFIDEYIYNELMDAVAVKYNSICDS